VNPLNDELQAISSILDFFGKASGLVTNMIKTEVFPVRYDEVDLADILADFPAKIVTFPGKYLGLPLHFRCLRKVDLQPLIDKIAGKLPIWMGKNLARPGRVTLAKSVLMAICIYHASVITYPNGQEIRSTGLLGPSFGWGRGRTRGTRESACQLEDRLQA
jgi:hypothetical protein